MDDDVKVAVTESLECSDLFTLGTNQARDNDVEQKCGHAKKDDGKPT